jgi:hypothetical protein
MHFLISVEDSTGVDRRPNDATADCSGSLRWKVDDSVGAACIIEEALLVRHLGAIEPQYSMVKERTA